MLEWQMKSRGEVRQPTDTSVRPSLRATGWQSPVRLKPMKFVPVWAGADIGHRIAPDATALSASSLAIDGLA